MVTRLISACLNQPGPLGKAYELLISAYFDMLPRTMDEMSSVASVHALRTWLSTLEPPQAIKKDLGQAMLDHLASWVENKPVIHVYLLSTVIIGLAVDWAMQQELCLSEILKDVPKYRSLLAISHGLEASCPRSGG